MSELEGLDRAKKKHTTAKKAASGPAKPKPKTKPKPKPTTPTTTPPPPPTPTRVTTFARQRERRLQHMVQDFELLSAVCLMHVKGATNAEILRALKKKFPKAGMKREDPNWLVRWAALRGWLRFRPPYHDEYRHRIRELYALQEVEGPDLRSRGAHGRSGCSQHLFQRQRTASREHTDPCDRHSVRIWHGHGRHRAIRRHQAEALEFRPVLMLGRAATFKKSAKTPHSLEHQEASGGEGRSTD